MAPHKYFDDNSKAAQKVQQIAVKLLWLVLQLITDAKSKGVEETASDVKKLVYRLIEEAESAADFLKRAQPLLGEARADGYIGEWARLTEAYYERAKGAHLDAASKAVGWDLGISESILGKMAKQLKMDLPTKDVMGRPQDTNDATSAASAAAEEKKTASSSDGSHVSRVGKQAPSGTPIDLEQMYERMVRSTPIVSGNNFYLMRQMCSAIRPSKFVTAKTTASAK